MFPIHPINAIVTMAISLCLLGTGPNAFTQTPGAALLLTKVSIDAHGAIVRGNRYKKEIALVLTGDEFADGGVAIRTVLHKKNVPASFFLTGNFYANPSFKQLILDLKHDGHYLGPHSDKHLLYADWTKRDSLLVAENVFKVDLQNNYQRMAAFGIDKKDAPYFLPPYEWYNSAIAQWTRDLDLQLVNFTPGTASAADYTYPEMKERYRPSDEIYQSIMKRESDDPHGLNGFILLIHIGTDPRRTDKFYNMLDKVVTGLRGKGYNFVRIDKLIR
jgi:peptidoglycan/xylan/chitin deacetylase (PgdA/CDA1 family)